MGRCLAAALVLISLVGGASASDTTKPNPVPESVPAPNQNTVVLCIGCSSPFDASIHEKLVKELVANAYTGELRKALYVQDSLYQFSSRAHFDNCDFDAAVAYIGSLLDEADSQVEQAKGFKARNDPASMQKAAKAAFFSIGQALHAVQDFYAHTNYVELSSAKAKSLDDIAIITPWNDKGKDAIAQLRRDGMISGFVFWGFPQLCPKGTPSHGDMAKDSESMPRGKVKVYDLQNYSQHKIAMYLARESSKALLEHAFKRWPLLKELNGEAVAFDVLVDRRGD
jgi:hypothetical protein